MPQTKQNTTEQNQRSVYKYQTRGKNKISQEPTLKAHARIEQMELLARFCMAEARESTTEERVLAYMACLSVHGEYFTGKGRRKELCERLGISKSTYNRAIEALVEAKVLKRLKASKIGSQFVSYRLPDIMFKARESEDNYTFTVEVKR